MSTLIDIKRGNSVIVTVKPNETTSSQVKKIMGDNQLNLSFILDSMVNLNVGDYAVVYGETYFLDKLPLIKKTSTYKYEYDLILQSYQFELNKAQYLFYDFNNIIQEGDFALYGTPDDFMDLLVKNMNRVSAGWTKGGVIQNAGYKNILFSKQNCLAALQTIAKNFDTEFYVDGTTIHLAKLQKPTGNLFKYGRNKGLYQISRTQLNNTSIITRVYALGGSNNLPIDYGGQRLRLPGGYKPCVVSSVTYTVVNNNNGTQTITFAWTPPSQPVQTLAIEYRDALAVPPEPWNAEHGGTNSGRSITVPLGSGAYEVRFRSAGAVCNDSVTASIVIRDTITTPVLTSTAIPYLENNTGTYGIIEDTYINDDIFPHRTGTVTSVDNTNPYIFTDTAIDFDVNNQLLPGLVAKVTFNTGQLAGYTFEISKFNNAAKTFTILKNKDEKTLDIPSNTIKMAIGDKYVLTDITMPQSYIDAAEQELLTKATDYLNTNSQPQYTYTIVCDPKYFRANNIKMDIGYIVTIEDIELQVSKAIRVIGLTKSIVDEFEYTLELGDVVSQSTLDAIRSAQTSTQNNVQVINNTLNNNALLSGTYIGVFTIKQGTLEIDDIETATDLTNKKPLYIDLTSKKIYRGS
jgi:hypothetical protein